MPDIGQQSCSPGAGYWGPPPVVDADCDQSPTIAKLATALSAAQAQIENAAKDSRNPHFQSKYADLASIRAAAEPIYAQGLSVVQQVISKGDLVGLRTVLAHSSGEWMASRVYLRPEKTGPQAAGSAITYLRRYMLAAVLGIAQEDDDGNAADVGKKANAKLARTAAQIQADAAEARAQAARSLARTGTSRLPEREPGADDDEGTVDRARSLMLKHPPEGMGWAPKHAAAWLKKYFGKEAPAQLTAAQAGDACQLLLTRQRTPELYPARLEMFHAEGRVLTGEYEK